MREWLIEKRKAQGMTVAQMASKCDCSRRLLEMIEYDDHVTHPDIASRMVAAYGLTLDEFNALVPEERRKKALPEPKAAPGAKDYYSTIYAREYRYKHNKR